MAQCRPIKIKDGRRRHFEDGDTIDPAILGTGTRTGSKFLKDDGSWSNPPSGTGGYDGDPTVIQQDATHRFATDAEKTSWNSKAAGNHNHAGVYSLVDHEHAGYALSNHNHDGTYEPANANIQTHIGSPHAPSNAQKNSDITKAEIEGKLTGEITSHTHPAAPGGSDPFVAKLRLTNDVSTGANVTLVDLTGMSFVYEANSTYVIELYMVVTAAAATTGHGFGVNCSTAPAMVAMNGTTQLANTGTATNWQAIANNAIIGVTSAVPTAGALTPSFGQGVLVTGATPGTCQFRFRSETTAVTVCKAGSCITVKKIS